MNTTKNLAFINISAIPFYFFLFYIRQKTTIVCFCDSFHYYRGICPSEKGAAISENVANMAGIIKASFLHKWYPSIFFLHFVLYLYFSAL